MLLHSMVSHLGLANQTNETDPCWKAPWHYRTPKGFPLRGLRDAYSRIAAGPSRAIRPGEVRRGVRNPGPGPTHM